MLSVQPQIRFAGARLGLFVLGLGLLAGGFAAPGSSAAAVTTLFVLGAALAAIACLLPALQEFEVGPGGVKTKLVSDAKQGPTLIARPEELSRFAYLTCGDAVEARELVEKAVARSRDRRLRLSPAERDGYALRTLIAQLETVPERKWMLRSGRREAERAASGPSEYDPAAVRRLQELEFARRVAFLLRSVMQLSVEEAASVLERPAEVVERDLVRAREALRPHIASNQVESPSA